MESEQIDAVLAEVAPLIDLALVQNDADESWVLAFSSDEPALLLERGARTGQMLLSALVAPLPADDAEAVMRTALAFNFQGPETGGARLALNDQDGTLHLFGDLTTGDLETQKLSDLLIAFRTLRQGWQNTIDGWALQAQPDTPAPMPSSGMRV